MHVEYEGDLQANLRGDARLGTSTKNGNDDNVGILEPGYMMTTSADSNGPWVAGGEENILDNRLREILCSQSDQLPIHRKLMQRRSQIGSFSSVAYLILLIATLWILPASAVFIEFQNCLSESVLNNTPLQLQIVPYFVSATFNTTDANHALNVTVWGNVTGSTVTSTRYVLPGPNDVYWIGNDTSNGGKIEDSPRAGETGAEVTTLFNKVNVLTYEPWDDNLDFCKQVVNGSCPLGPSFNATRDDPYSFPSFGFQNNFFSTYAFTSFTTTLLVKYGDVNTTPILCVSAEVTPDLGSTLTGVITFIPVVILVCVGLATAVAAIWSPWGTTDIFRWTTNYGRDADLLRLVTPGFGDCLQYIQFVALTGGLTLNYPGFYQPIVSKVSWSSLMFNQSFVSNGTGAESLIDGIYVTHGEYGMDRLRQLIGMSEVKDVWTGMAIWLLVIIAAVLTLIQIGFFVRWAYHHINKTQEEDLRAKNIPFSVGNVIRVVFNYFLLPIVALSMFQLVVATESPAYTVALAVVMLLLIIGFAVWLLYIVASTRPKSVLFDDLPTVITYGSLYNTYKDHAAPFALIPILLTIVRGVAIGAVQPSGIAQLVLLAICEVITILTLHAFQPFHSPTSMNAYHTFFSVVRLTTILLMISFLPSLGVTEGPKGWVAYAILLMHAIVLIFGFLLNAIQTIVEVAARHAGAGTDESGAARGGLVKVFGMRQLSRRLPRHAASRQSQLSNAAMLDAENDRKSYLMDAGRMRSQSAGSTGVLLNRASTGLDSMNNSSDPFGAIPPHQLGSGHSSFGTPTTPGEASTFSFLPSTAAPSGLGRNRAPILGLGGAEASDPYYRPPRMRRPTLETYSPGAKSRASWASGDWAAKASSTQPEGAETPAQVDEGPSISGRNSPIQAIPLDGSPGDARRSKADYTTREVDFYYGVRGPALNANIPSRRIKTGPQDPTGIPATAAGWFKSLFGGKTKEKGKGFEVVRSARMPPGMRAPNRPGQETPPEGIPVATGGIRNGPIDSDDESVHAGPSAKPARPSSAEGDALVSPEDSDDERYGDENYESTRISDIPPTLSGLDIPGGGIELPSRFPSKATSRGSSRRGRPIGAGEGTTSIPLVPSVPRKSSRRQSRSVDLALPPSSHHRYQSSVAGSTTSRLPFDRTNSKSSSAAKRRSEISSGGSGSDLADLGHSRNLSSSSGTGIGGFAYKEDDRPTSVGYVNQHSIRTINPNQENDPRFLGSSAEVVDDGGTGNSSDMEGRRKL